MPVFQVLLERASTRTMSLSVEADTMGAAQAAALNRAGGMDFHDGTESEPAYAATAISGVSGATEKTSRSAAERIKTWLEAHVEEARPGAKDVFTIDGAYQTFLEEDAAADVDQFSREFGEFRDLHGGITVTQALALLEGEIAETAQTDRHDGKQGL